MGDGFRLKEAKITSWASHIIPYFEIFSTAFLTFEIALRIFAHTPRHFFFGSSVSTLKALICLDGERIANWADFLLTAIDIAASSGAMSGVGVPFEEEQHHDERDAVIVGGHMTGSLAKVAGRSVGEAGRLIKLVL